MVVSSPTWPPLSVPSAMTASAPARATTLARATAGITGNTLAPDSFQAGMNRAGSPAPVVTTATFSWAAMAASCSTWGCISMMLTPKGFSVSVRQRRMLS